MSDGSMGAFSRAELRRVDLAAGALRARGYTLGHFPSSILCSTVGGWVATRSSGQESLGFGRIEFSVKNVFAHRPVEKKRLLADDADPPPPVRPAS